MTMEYILFELVFFANQRGSLRGPDKCHNYIRKLSLVKTNISKLKKYRHLGKQKSLLLHIFKM